MSKKSALTDRQVPHPAPVITTVSKAGNGTGSPKHNGNHSPSEVTTTPMGLQPAHYAATLVSTAHDAAVTRPCEAPAPDEWGEESKRRSQRANHVEALTAHDEKLAAYGQERAAQGPRYLPPKWQWQLIFLMTLCALGVLALVSACTLNAARFAVNVVETWFAAILFTCVIPAIAIGLEFYASWLTERYRTFKRLMACVFVLSGATFLVCFVNEFGIEPDLTTVDDLLGGFDYRVMLFSQCLLEISISFVLLEEMRHLCWELGAPVENRLAARLDDLMEREESGKQQHRQAIQELDAKSAIFNEKLGRYLAYQEAVRRQLNQLNH